MWMTRRLLTVTPEDSLVAVADLMTRHRIRRIPVVKESPSGARLEGIISYSDVLHVYPKEANPFSPVSRETLMAEFPLESNLKVRDLMRANPLTTTPEEPIERAAQLMRDKKIGALPVVQGRNLVGLITESDLFRAFASIFETDAKGIRVTFDISAGEDVFPKLSEIVLKHKLRLITFVTLQKHERPLCVVQVSGAQVENMIEDLWAFKHPVVSVIHLPWS
ncbi:CBS domain-containing protein [Ferrovum sp.]|uniref:CBS domain-containing protein n=2 Tax=Ferrovum sp. TaxID=2609467 RepID=UPI0026183043|nr:CBS domain-containing protein [Ferrovum sp.]